MAEAFARHFGQGTVEAYSAGSNPASEVDPKAVKVMQEVGIDISSARAKGFDGLPYKDFDCAVMLGCKDRCPFIPAEKHIEWEIEDPRGKDIELFRRTRDEIKGKVLKLVKELSSPLGGLGEEDYGKTLS
jgi:arsenate reductase